MHVWYILYNRLALNMGRDCVSLVIRRSRSCRSRLNLERERTSKDTVIASIERSTWRYCCANSWSVEWDLTRS